MLSLRQSLTRIGKQPPIRIPSELPVPSKSLRETLDIWNPFQYGITIVTGTLNGAGTDANVYIMLFGDSAGSNEISLPNAGAYFERGKTDYFEIVAPDVGELRRIRVRHDNSGDCPGWFLSRITVRNLKAPTEWTFHCNRWLARDEDDREISRDLYCETECTEYRIGVVTGSCDSAGTDANVYIMLFGTHGQTDELFLDNGNANFERGQTDYFTVYTRQVRDLKSMRVRHDNSGDCPGWFLAEIVVRDLSAGLQWHFLCNRWLATDEDDHQIERILSC